MTAITVPQGFKVTPKQFDELANSNTNVRMELTAQGKLMVMPPTGRTAGRKNCKSNVKSQPILEKLSEPSPSVVLDLKLERGL